jgi:predicted secreted Zn-dependent protease
MFPKVTYEKFSGGCRVDTAKVTVDARVTLPQWTGRDTADEKLANAWDNIDRYTRLHEATHVNMAFSYAKRIEDEVLAMRSMANCSELRAATKVVVDRNLKAHDAAQRKYDADEQKRFSMLAKRTKITESL